MASRQLTFRIDSDIADEALRMAAKRGMELPDVLRMTLTKAVRDGEFSLDVADAPPTMPDAHPNFAYEDRYWEPMKSSLDAEAAMAMLSQAIARRTTWLDEGLKDKTPDLKRLERIRNERDAACALLAAFDPSDKETISRVFEMFGSASPERPSDTGSGAAK